MSAFAFLAAKGEASALSIRPVRVYASFADSEIAGTTAANDGAHMP